MLVPKFLIFFTVVTLSMSTAIISKELGSELEATTQRIDSAEETTTGYNIDIDIITNFTQESDSLIELKTRASEPRNEKSISSNTQNEFTTATKPEKFGDRAVLVSELTDDLLTWKAPLFIQQASPYYQTGYDDEGRPVWVAELGKFPYFRILNGGEETIKILDKYVRQAALRIINSIKSQNTTDRPVNEAIYVVDGEGIKLNEIIQPRSLLFIVSYFRAYKDIITDSMGQAIVINMNYLAEMLVNLLRPVLGKALEKVELHGTNRAKWISALRRSLPEEVIPPWYGGSREGFKPIQVYA